MKKDDEINWIKGLIEKFPMTIYLQEALTDHIEDLMNETKRNKCKR